MIVTETKLVNLNSRISMHTQASSALEKCVLTFELLTLRSMHANVPTDAYVPTFVLIAEAIYFKTVERQTSKKSQTALITIPNLPWLLPSWVTDER